MSVANSVLRPSWSARLLWWLIPLVVALWAGWDLLAPWDVNGHSVYLNHIRLVALEATLREGGLSLRWLPQLYFGHGSPLFNYVAPLPTLLALVLVWMGLSASMAIKLVYLGALLGAALSTAWLARILAGPWAGLGAGVLVVLAPYALVNVYVRAQFGEPVALALAPLALVAVHRLDGPRPWRSVALGACAVGLLVLSHNIAALMLFALVAAAVAAKIWAHPRRELVLRGAVFLGLGLGLSAWLWLPALAETSAVQARAALTSGPFAYDLHFVTFGQLLGDSWGYGVSGPGDQDSMPLQAGRALLLLWAAGALLTARRWRETPALARVMVLAAPVALFLTTAASAPLWRHVPLLPFMQFPWRFLLLFCLAAAVTAGLALGDLAGRLHPPWREIVLGLTVVLIVVMSQHQVNAMYLRFNLATHESAIFVKNNGPSIDQDPNLVPIGEVYTASNIVRLGVSATIGDDYLPRAVEDKPRAPSSQPVEVIAGALQVISGNSAPQRHSAVLRVDQDARLRFPLFYFPGWIARLDGTEIPVEVEPRSGCIVIDVPRGEHELVLQFASTPLRSVSTLLSLLAGMAVLVLLLGSWWACRRRAITPAPVA
ncbi:MAG: hypothetical protein ABIJ09_11090 [Pseudomonadota bacterium]